MHKLPAILGLILLLGLCGCAITPPNNNPVDAPASQGVKEGGNMVQLVAVKGNEPAEAVFPEDFDANGVNQFAFRFSAAMAAGNDDENFVCSPFSVWLPLAALANATDESHRRELIETIGAGDMTAEEVNRIAGSFLYYATRQQNKQDAEVYGIEYYNPFRTANALFVSREYNANKEFAQVFADSYLGAMFQVDFLSPGAVDAVNAWASENTDGLITDVIQTFAPETVAAIANAIYYSDRWRWEFDKEETEQGAFHAPGGDTQAWFMLREGNTQSYYEDESIQAMPLDFVTGGRLWIILPKDGDANGLLSSMTAADFSKINSGCRQRSGKLLLPRFEIGGDPMKLVDTLKLLGVPLFDREAAPLTGGLLEEKIPVWLSDAVQKAMIRVDEEGTTAAAVTVMAAVGSSMPLPTEPFELVCDRPFVFVLTDFDQVLFTGIVNQP
ncbi:MAG: hypothetical protein LBS10_00005 [Gracilibacteraceae bacterium]|jgi:serpin B|nr:hypothetical protein [Gracilibacteraceae bacterium]